jgi:hypothetical protein
MYFPQSTNINRQQAVMLVFEWGLLRCREGECVTDVMMMAGNEG